MATILAFPERRTGDWTEAERARLTELAGRFAAQVGVNIAYGISDVGDPWCVVLDAHEEVLVHVARVNGTFVAHTLAGDGFAEARDLETAVETILGTRWLEDREGAVVPFAATSRQAQVVTAVLVAAAFVEHHRAEAATDDWALATAQLRKLPDDGREGRGDEALKAAVAVMSDGLDRGSPAAAPIQADAAAPPSYHNPSAPAIDVLPAPADDPTPPKIHLDLSALLADETIAPVGDDAVVLIGTDGPDASETAPDTSRLTPAPFRLLEGSIGDDLLLLDGGTVAIGGDGADRFVLAAPVPGEAPHLIGAILDFDPHHDVILVDGAAGFTIVSRTPVADVLGAGADGGLPVVAGERVEIDVNGDGRGDGHFLLAGASDAATSDVHAVLGAFHSGAAGGLQLPDPAHPAMIQPADHIA